MKTEIIKEVKVREFGGVRNQFEITTKDGIYFQSYRSIIAFKPYCKNGVEQKIQLDAEKWDYSRTTGKYRNQFLGEDKKTTEKKIKSGQYQLVNLN